MLDLYLESVGFNSAAFQLANVNQEQHSNVFSLTSSAHYLNPDESDNKTHSKA